MNKQITVWGGSGFIGSHVCDFLSKKNFKVIVADRVKSQYLNKSQKMFVGNINNILDVEKSIKGSHYVFNFAGIASLDESKTNPIEVINSNILGNINILEGCRKFKIKKYIFASTIYVFSKYGGLYKSSKQSCELFLKEYEKLFNLKYNILRFGTVYGPRTDSRNAIYNYLKLALENKEIKIRSNKKIIREYIHVNDVSSLCYKILNSKYDNQDLVLTGNYTTRIEDLIKLISEVLGKKLKVKYLTKTDNMHYEITPYSYQINLSKKIHLESSIDLGQGIINLIDFINKKD